MRILNRKINPTMIELMVGIILFGVIGSALFIGLHLASVGVEDFFRDTIFNIVLGYILGIILSIVMIVHMTSSIEKALDMGEKAALKHTRIMYAVRIVVLIIVFIVMIFVGIGNVFALMLGIMSLKLSAYIHPLTHKLISRLRTDESKLEMTKTSL